MILRQAGNPGIERPLPHNPEAEKSILGAVTLDSATPNAALAQALEKLRPDDFFIPQHRHIFEQMVKLGENHDPISTVSLMETLEVAGQLEAAGGVAYLAGLAAGFPRDTDVESLAGIVKKKSLVGHALYPTAAIHEQLFAPCAAGEIDIIRDRLRGMVDDLETNPVGTAEPQIYSLGKCANVLLKASITLPARSP